MMRRSFLTRRIVLLTVVYVATVIFCITLYCIFLVYNKDMDFERIDEIYRNKDYEKALQEYVYYIKDNKDLKTDKLWEAYQRVLYITVQLKGDIKGGIQLLYSMQTEYKDDAEKEYAIYKELLRLHHIQNEEDKVLHILTTFLDGDVFPLTQEERIGYYRRYLVLVSKDKRNFAQGVLFLKTRVEREKDIVQSWAQYGLATIYMLSEQYKKSTDILQSILEKHSLREEIGYLSQYMLATIAVANGEKAKALEYALALKEYYPNQKALDTFIKKLK